MENQIVQNIGKKLEVSIAVYIFIAVLSQTATSTMSDNSQMIFIFVAAFIGLQIINYGLYYIKYDSLTRKNSYAQLINILLTTSFILAGISITLTILLLSKEVVGPQSILRSSEPYIFMVTMLIPLIIFLILLIFQNMSDYDMIEK